MSLAAAAASGFIVFLLSVQVIQGQYGWGVTYSSTEICAVKGSTVEIHCSYTYPSSINGHHATVEKTFWFTKIYPYDPVDLTTDPQYSGRVQYHCANNYCTLRITDLRESDSAEYKFRFTTNPLSGYIGSPGVTLSVTGLQVSRSNNGLECQNSCVPDRYSFIWYKNGQKIQEEASSSYLSNFNYKDSYSCAVKGYEDSPSPPTCADGETCNRVTYTDRNICASKGSSVDISCTYSSYKNHVESKFWFSPERKGQWQNPSQPADLCKDSQFAGRVQVIDTERGRSTLRITDLRESDSAEYHFKFTAPSFEWRSSLPGTTLTVTALQVQVTRITVRQSVTEAELKCHSSCSPAGRLSYVWLNNKEEITGVETSSYKAQFGLSDNVSCAIRGREQFPSPSVYAPKLPSVSPSAEIVEGRSVTLTCSSDANPAAKYTWYKWYVNRHPLSEGPQLVFRSIQSSDSGQYYCTAENQLGRRTSHGFTMDVKYAPRVPSVSVSPSGKIMEGSSVTLTCSSDAKPAAKKTWYMENQKVLQGSDGVHQFISISSEDRGKYYCTSENQHGRINSSSIFIDVQYAPKLPSVSPSAEIVEGSSVTLTCSSDANPAAKYTWYKKTVNVRPLSEGPQLVFSSIQSSDSGQYYCRAENQLGRKTSHGFTMDVKYAPRVPSVSVSPSGKIMEGSSVTLTCKSDAKPAAKKTWYKENQTLYHGPENIYLFPNISSKDSGIYYCKSENKYGKNISTAVHIDVQYAPKLPSVSVSPSAEIVEGDSVNLTCSSDANPAAKYTWYKEDEDSPKASGQIFTITDIRAEHSGNYYCEAQNTRGRHNSTFNPIIVSRSMKSVASGSITAIFLAIIFLLAFLFIRRKRSSKQTPEPRQRSDNNAQANMGAVYDIPPAPRQTTPSEQQDDLCYASVSFSKNQEDPLYSNVRLNQPNRHREEEEDEDDVEYSVVNCAGAATQSIQEEPAEDSSVLYSTVLKKPRV